MTKPPNTTSQIETTAPGSGKKRFRLFGDGVLTLADQAIVSGTNFLTTVIIGRAAGEEELGLYAIGFTIVVLLMGAQESLVSMPYTVFGHRCAKDQLTRLRGMTLLHQLGFCLSASAALLFAGIITSLVAVDSGFVPVLYVLAATVLVIGLRDFVRRIAFADFQVRTAIVLDFLVCLLQLVGITALARLGSLSAVTTQAWVGVACAVATLIVVTKLRPDVRMTTLGLSDLTRKHWVFGRWLLFGQLLGIANGYLMHWLLALMLGAAQAGIFAACLTPVFFTNPLILGVANYLTPRLSKIAACDGNQALWRPVLAATALLASTLSAVLLGAFFFGEEVMHFLFGERFAGNGLIVTIVTFAILLKAIGVAPGNALRAINIPAATFVGQLLTLIVSFSMAVALIPKSGIQGAAYSMVVGYAVGNVARWILFWVYSKRDKDQQS